MNTCKNCAHWYYGNSERGECQQVGYSWNNYEDRPVNTKADGMVIDVRADDDSGLQATLYTHPDFGCNRFDANAYQLTRYNNEQ